MTDPRRVHWLGVSVPRSGHHYLVSLFERLLGTELRYCETYNVDGCCRQVPCSLATSHRFLFQKNHDHDLAVPADLEGVTYVVQLRDPVMAILSDREYLAACEGEALAADRDEHVSWLASWVVYFERFYRKWVEADAPRGNRVFVDYDDLVTRTASELARILSASGLEIPGDRIADAVRAGEGSAASFPSGKRPPGFRVRADASSRYIDPELLAAAESILIERVPDLRRRRRFAAVDVASHPLQHAVRAEEARRDGDPELRLRHLSAALSAYPANRRLTADAAATLAALGHTRAALRTLDVALEQAPNDAALLRARSDLLLTRGDEILGLARGIAERLVTLRPEDPGMHVHLATILLRGRDKAGAVRHAERATQLGPRDARVWRHASEILKECQSWASAAAAVRSAIAIAPGVAEYHHHLGNLLALDGRLDEAVAAQRRAIELDPSQPGWRWKLSDDLRRLGDLDAARTVTRDALTVFPGDETLARQAQALGLEV